MADKRVIFYNPANGLITRVPIVPESMLPYNLFPLPGEALFEDSYELDGVLPWTHKIDLGPPPTIVPYTPPNLPHPGSFFADPDDWYFKVLDTNPTTERYSTAVDAFVPITDPDYLAWLNTPTSPPRQPTEVATFALLMQAINQQAFQDYVPSTLELSVTAANLENPLPSQIIIHMGDHGPGNDIKLPRMNTTESMPIGFSFEIICAEDSVSGFGVYKWAEFDIGDFVATIRPGEAVKFRVTDNATPGGEFTTTERSLILSRHTGAAKGVQIKNNTTSPNTKLDIAVAKAVFNDAYGHTKGPVAFSGTVDMDVVGPGGRKDAILYSGDQRLYVWLILGPQLKALVSSDPPSLLEVQLPPTGYTYFCYLGSVYWDASQHFEAINIGDHSIKLNDRTNSRAWSNEGADGQIYVAQTDADPEWKTATGDIAIDADGVASMPGALKASLSPAIAMAVASDALRRARRRIKSIAVTKITSTQTFAANEFDPDELILAWLKGGGGGGAGGTNTNSLGGGGGEGATSWKLTTGAALNGLTATIGAGGANVAANTDANGGTGGTTSLGTVASAPGGGGGTKASTGGTGGPGGTGGTNDWGEPGISGSVGETADGTKAIASVGGGRGGGGVFANGAANSGGGGGGGWQANASGAGGSGIIVLIRFRTR